jgi:hypothetical protein
VPLDDRTRVHAPLARYEFDGSDQLYDEVGEAAVLVAALANSAVDELYAGRRDLSDVLTRKELAACLRDRVHDVPQDEREAAHWRAARSNQLALAKFGTAVERAVQNDIRLDYPDVDRRLTYQPRNFAELYANAVALSASVPNLGLMHYTRERPDWVSTAFPRMGIDLTTPAAVAAHQQKRTTGHDLHMVTYDPPPLALIKESMWHSLPSFDQRKVRAHNERAQQAIEDAIRLYPHLKTEVDKALEKSEAESSTMATMGGSANRLWLPERVREQRIVIRSAGTSAAVPPPMPAAIHDRSLDMHHSGMRQRLPVRARRQVALDEPTVLGPASTERLQRQRRSTPPPRTTAPHGGLSL